MCEGPDYGPESTGDQSFHIYCWQRTGLCAPPKFGCLNPLLIEIRRMMSGSISSRISLHALTRTQSSCPPPQTRLLGHTPSPSLPFWMCNGRGRSSRSRQGYLTRKRHESHQRAKQGRLPPLPSIVSGEGQDGHIQSTQVLASPKTSRRRAP